MLDLILKTMKLLDHFLHTALHPTRYRKPPRYLNVGFLTTHGNLKEICLELNPSVTALQISHIVASYLRLPREFDSTLQVSLLPYGFESNDPRLLDFIARFPRNLVDREKFIHNLAPRRPGFPKLPAQRMVATTIYPHTLMMDLPGLNEKVVDMLTGPENMLLMYWPVARMFDEGLITIEKLLLDDPDVIDGENTDEEYEEEEYGFFLRVNYVRLLDSRVFAKEDWENREHRERLRWKHIDGKRITFSDDGQMAPYPDFLAFHSQLSTVIFGEIELMESEDDVQNTLAHIFEKRSDLSISDTSSVFSISRPDSPGPPRWRFPLFK
ncbi:hypothetical protein TWF102_010150 [Orbilia oligospora]|uniref:Uncharacterized protein n=1 Tax=Orbilia oligospora TaxID=2813651 RepID=A0A7C8J5E8_ORBOL|nr:hypothetical protein TWF102_010150 [Orbilia oligospora]